MPKTYDNTKLDFVIAEQVPAFVSHPNTVTEARELLLHTLTWLEKQKICLQTSNKLRDDILSYWIFPFG